SNHYDRISDLDREIQQNQEKVEELKKSLNPFKLKENNMMKRRHLDKISDLEGNKQTYIKGLERYKESLRFSTKEEFYQRYQEFSQKKEDRLHQIKYEKKQIRVETKVLNEAEHAIKQAKVREVSAHYPDLKAAGQHLSYNNALKLEKYHNIAEKHQFSLSSIKDQIDQNEKELYKLKQNQKIIHTEKKHISDMGLEVKTLKSVEDQITALDNKPGEKAIRFVSKKARQNYEELQHEASHRRENLKEMGYKGQDDLQQREKRMSTMEKTVVPALEKEIHTHTSNLEALNTVFNALQQAIHTQEQSQQKHQLRRFRSSSINRNKDQGPDLSI
ncbi:molybdopterin-guanine dinucleotide biosynthesis protein MobA, partial (plasmid) [Priestia aryabhattai]